MFTCVKNLTSNPQSIPHDGDEPEIFVGPYGMTWLKNPDGWKLDNPLARNLISTVRAGYVEIVEREIPPLQFSVPNYTMYPNIRQKDIEDMKVIMFAEENETAMRIVNQQPREKAEYKTGDKKYLKTNLLPMLKFCLDVYKKFDGHVDFPNKVYRMRKIVERIKFLEEMT